MCPEILEHSYTKKKKKKKLYILYPKFSFNWASHILSGNGIKQPKLESGKMRNNGINVKSKR